MFRLESINSFFDSLPRPRLSCTGREEPTYLACGVAGFYFAVIVIFGGGLLAGRSLLVIALLGLVSGLSFYAYAYLRMWVVGHEEIVLLEHVWFTFACVTVTLWFLREPVLPYLDIISAALSFFLAAGRIGCTLVGCCHGHPSSIGITYPKECASDGFPNHLTGVRLFPVPTIEAAGLFVIGVTGVIALPLAQPGKVFVWFLLAYSVMRFGLEGLRADPRPHFLGLSQARWMAIIEVALALRLTAGDRSASLLAVYAPLFATLVLVLAYRWRRDWRRLLLESAHVREVRELARAQYEGGSPGHVALPMPRATSRRVTVAVSSAETVLPGAAHISISLPDGRGDLLLVCELAARAFPRLIIAAAQSTSGKVLHLFAPVPLADNDADAQTVERISETLYGSIVRRLQSRGGAITQDAPDVEYAFADQLESKKPPEAAPVTHPPADAAVGDKTSLWFFAEGRKSQAR